MWRRFVVLPCLCVWQYLLNQIYEIDHGGRWTWLIRLKTSRFQPSTICPRFKCIFLNLWTGLVQVKQSVQRLLKTARNHIRTSFTMVQIVALHTGLRSFSQRAFAGLQGKQNKTVLKCIDFPVRSPNAKHPKAMKCYCQFNLTRWKQNVFSKACFPGDFLRDVLPLPSIHYIYLFIFLPASSTLHSLCK